MRRIVKTMIGTGLLAFFSGPAVSADGPADALTLEQALELAKKNNPTLKIARERLHQAEAMIDKAWVMVKPQLSVTGTYTHYNTEAKLALPEWDSISIDPQICGSAPWCFERMSTVTIQKQDSFGALVSLSQPILLARAFSTIKNAYNAYDQAKLNTENQEEVVLHSLEVAYLGALTAKKFLDAAQKAVELSREHLKVARAKFEVGDQPKITVLRAEIDLNRAEQDVRQAESSLLLSKEAIGLLLGRDPDFCLVQPQLARRPADGLDAFIGRAQARRRDLGVARLGLAIAEKSKQDAWLRFLPTLALTGLFRLSDVGGFSDEHCTWQIGLALSIPLYDGGLRTIAIEQAESQIRQARIELEEKKRAIKSEIRTLWLKMEIAEANLEKARRALELANEQAQLSKISFEAGTVGHLDVLDANHLLFLSEISVARLELNKQLTILKLIRSVRMFDPSDSMTPSGALAPAASEGAPTEQGNGPDPRFRSADR